ncbi:phosphate-starvation-inducible PsiE family protein [Candidatus Desantisbacteria bacterium]|nr:phosphate-starvation-inducible PsiE family protein [Candidatus Desantisbacteria bacterium]
MKNLSEILNDFNFNQKDIENLKSLKPIMTNNKNKMSDYVYNSMIEFKEFSKFLPENIDIDKRKSIFSEWFMDLFEGIYDHKHLSKIQNIGFVQAKIKFPAHYRNVVFLKVRKFCMDILISEIKDDEERMDLYHSLEKILAINHDIMSDTYREEMLGQVSLKYKIEKKLIHITEMFTYGLNISLVIALMVISLFVVSQFINDIWSLLNGHTEHGVTNILGTLLMLWVMIELMDTEIEHLKHGKFSITIFVEIVLVAVIRDILIGTLEHGAFLRQATLAGTVLILGFVYWFMSGGENRKFKGHN